MVGLTRMTQGAVLRKAAPAVVRSAAALGRPRSSDLPAGAGCRQMPRAQQLAGRRLWRSGLG
eukprot:5374507-Alexandrium_andersonii.AAC.1